MSSIYFLQCLGFNDIYLRNDKELKPQHKLVAQDYRGWYWDDFTCEMGKLIGLKMNWKDGNGNDITNIAGEDVMLLVLECVKSLIKLKIAFSIDLLMLSCVYANYVYDYDFFNVLQSTIVECLNGNDDSFKARNYQWFKHFILNSNVWVIKMPNEKASIYEKYKGRILGLAHNHDSGALIKHLFWKPHVVLSMIVEGKDDSVILYIIHCLLEYVNNLMVLIVNLFYFFRIVYFIIVL